eukprot:superscaffoldBa00007278_g22382
MRSLHLALLASSLLLPLPHHAPPSLAPVPMNTGQLDELARHGPSRHDEGGHLPDFQQSSISADLLPELQKSKSLLTCSQTSSQQSPPTHSQTFQTIGLPSSLMPSLISSCPPPALHSSGLPLLHPAPTCSQIFWCWLAFLASVFIAILQISPVIITNIQMGPAFITTLKIGQVFIADLQISSAFVADLQSGPSFLTDFQSSPAFIADLLSSPAHLVVHLVALWSDTGHVSCLLVALLCDTGHLS